MSTITTTNLSWSATWSQAPVMPDALNVVIYGRQALQHGNSIVSSSSETSSAYDDTTGDTVALSREAQAYVDTQGSGITENDTLSKIYDRIVEVISSSTTSDAEKWNAFVADQRLADEGSQRMWGGVTNVFCDSSAMATPYMQKIKAAYDDLGKNGMIASNQMERDIEALIQEESEVNTDEMWGSSSLSINVQQITAQTDAGTVTSFSISSELSGKMEYAPGTGPNTPNAQKISAEAFGLPASFSAYDSDQVVKISGNNYDLKAEFEKEVVDELFGSSDHKSMADKSAARQKTDATAQAGAASTSGAGSETPSAA
jgi:hypothetical protein